MKFLLVVTPLSIYHGFSTRKTFWEEKFTGKEEYFFLSVNMKNCGRCKVRKHKEIKDSDRIVTLNISDKFDSMNKMETTSSESKGKFGKIRKGVGNRSGFQDQIKVLKSTKRQGIPSEMSARRNFRRLSKILRKLESYLMRIIGPNMSQLPATFI